MIAAASAQASTIPLQFPHLPDESSWRVQWREATIEYVRGRSLGGYRQELHIDPAQLSRIKMDDGDVAISALDSHFPRRGATIKIIPRVDGKNTSLILGVLGAIIGAALAV